MDDILRKNKALIFIFFLVIAWWFSIFLRGIHEETENYLFSLAYSIMPLGSGILGYINSNHWGGLKSSIGRGVFFVSTGLIAWGIGNIIFGYYNLVLNISIPSPSFADFGFLLLYPLSAIGIGFFSKATGASIAIKSRLGKILLFIIPLLSLSTSYYLLFIVARGGVIDTSQGFLVSLVNILYPIGDVAVITMTVLVYVLSLKYLGGYFKKSMLCILIGLLFVYIADFLFLYTVTDNTYYVGKWVDIFYPTAFLFIALGLSLLNPKFLDRGK